MRHEELLFVGCFWLHGDGVPAVLRVLLLWPQNTNIPNEGKQNSPGIPPREESKGGRKTGRDKNITCLTNITCSGWRASESPVFSLVPHNGSAWSLGASGAESGPREEMKSHKIDQNSIQSESQPQPPQPPQPQTFLELRSESDELLTSSRLWISVES